MKMNSICIVIVCSVQFGYLNTASYYQDFLDAADTLKTSAERMTHALIEPRSPNPAKRNKPARFFTLKKKYKPEIPAESYAFQSQCPAVPKEKIFDCLMQSLGFYISCQRAHSFLARTHIRIQVAECIHIMKSLFPNVDLYAPTTIFEADHQEIFSQANELMKRPLVYEKIIEHIEKEQAPVKVIHGTRNAQLAAQAYQLAAHIKIMLHLFNREEESYQKCICYAYAQESHYLLASIAEEYRSHELCRQALSDQRITLPAPALQPLFEYVAFVSEEKERLYRKSKMLEHAQLLQKFIQEQSKLLRKLYCVQRAYDHLLQPDSDLDQTIELIKEIKIRFILLYHVSCANNAMKDDLHKAKTEYLAATQIMHPARYNITYTESIDPHYVYMQLLSLSDQGVPFTNEECYIFYLFTRKFNFPLTQILMLKVEACKLKKFLREMRKECSLIHQPSSLSTPVSSSSEISSSDGVAPIIAFKSASDEKSVGKSS